MTYSVVLVSKTGVGSYRGTWNAQCVAAVIGIESVGLVAVGLRQLGACGAAEVKPAVTLKRQLAATLGINLLAQVGIRAMVLKMDGAKDPDEFIKKFGAEAFRHLIESSGNAIDYEMDKLTAGLDMMTEDGKSAYIKKAVGFLAGISDDLHRNVYISRAARLADIPADTVRVAVEAEMKRRKRKNDRDFRRELIHPRNSDKINPESYKMPREEKAERGIICALYHNPEKLDKIQEKLNGSFVTEFNKRVFAHLVKMVRNGTTPDISLFNEEFEGSEMGRITAIVSDNMLAYDNDALEDYIKTLNEYGADAARKDAASMTTDEMLRLAQELKEKKK